VIRVKNFGWNGTPLGEALKTDMEVIRQYDDYGQEVVDIFDTSRVARVEVHLHGGAYTTFEKTG
jgi:hypothetical protein